MNISCVKIYNSINHIQIFKKHYIILTNQNILNYIKY